MSKKSIPCYVPNGGVHNVLNIPLGMFQRMELKKFLRELDARQRDFQTMFVAHATRANIALVRGLLQILDIDIKKKATRREAVHLLSAHEKNLKHNSTAADQQTQVNFVDLSLSFGLLAILFILAAHINYLESVSL